MYKNSWNLTNGSFDVLIIKLKTEFARVVFSKVVPTYVFETSTKTKHSLLASPVAG